MKTAAIKRSIRINGKKTSVSLENEFWARPARNRLKSKNTTAAKLAGRNRAPTQYRQFILRYSDIRLQPFSARLGEKQAADRGHDPARRAPGQRDLADAGGRMSRFGCAGLTMKNRAPQCSGLPPTTSEWPRMRRDQSAQPRPTNFLAATGRAVLASTSILDFVN